MHLDIILFALVAVVLIYRLYSVFGTKHGDERERPNPFTGDGETSSKPANRVVPLPQPKKEPRVFSTIGLEDIIDAEINKDARIETGLAEIAEADLEFDIHEFMRGARYAFELVVTSFSRGDRDALRPLLSPKLFGDFSKSIEAREKAGQTAETILHRIKHARIVEAHLGGAMAYITVDFDVEETTYTKDKDGKIIDGDPDRIFSIEDVWTFTRDTRTNDPNWILIETRAAEK